MEVEESFLGELRLKQVYVIDDDIEMRALLADVLSRHGYRVKVFESGLEALKAITIASKNDPDAVICDLIMPDLDGREVTRRFKSLLPKVPVILITGFGSALPLKEALNAGAHHLLTKPFGISELIEALRIVA